MKPSLSSSFLLCVAAVAAVASGCQQLPEGQPLPPVATTVVEKTVLLDWLPNPNHVPLYAGIEKGFFEKRGLHITLLRLHDTADCLPMVSSRQVDMAIGCTPYVLGAMSRGYPLKIVATWIDTSLTGFFFREESDIRTIADLAGRDLGSASLGPVNQALLKSCSEAAGISFGDVRRISFDGVVNLASKSIDAVFGMCYNIEPEQLRALGIEPGYLLIPTEIVPDFSELIFIGNEESLKDNPEFAENFRAAVQESLDFAVAHPDEAFALYLKANPHKTGETAAWEARSWAATVPVLARSQEIDLAKWVTFYEWMREHGLITTPFHMEQIFEKGLILH